jgi:hypothetical protein
MKTTPNKITKKVVAKKAPKAKVAKVAKSKSGSIAVTGTTTKKVATKKIVAGKGKKQLLVASNYNSFWMNDGQILNSLEALAGALKNMEVTVYKYHTADGRHDFANWVEDVLADVDCAVAMRKAKTPKSAHTVVVKHLALYK